MCIKMTSLADVVSTSLFYLCGRRFGVIIEGDCLLVEGKCMSRRDLMFRSGSAKDFYEYLREFISKNEL